MASTEIPLGHKSTSMYYIIYNFIIYKFGKMLENAQRESKPTSIHWILIDWVKQSSIHSTKVCNILNLTATAKMFQESF